MKKYKILFLTFLLILTCSCSFKKDDLEDADIYTTVYPIEYISKYLYSEHGNIYSVYPKDADTSTYELSNKQIKNYAKGKLFIYNGLTNEKNIAKSLINQNKNLLIIDVSYGLSINDNVDELWLNPRNYLVLAKNIKINLSSYLESKYIIEDIENKYKNFEEEVSLIDASLQNLGKSAKENNKSTLVVSTNSYKYLENYGFNIISLEDESNQKESKLDTIKANFKSSKYKYILTVSKDEENEIINELTENYNAKTLIINEFDSNENSYQEYMINFVENIKTIVS